MRIARSTIVPAHETPNAAVGREDSLRGVLSFRARPRHLYRRQNNNISNNKSGHQTRIRLLHHVTLLLLLYNIMVQVKYNNNMYAARGHGSCTMSV